MFRKKPKELATQELIIEEEEKVIHIIEMTNGKQWRVYEGVELVDEGERLALYTDNRNVRIQKTHIVAVVNFI